MIALKIPEKGERKAHACVIAANNSWFAIIPDYGSVGFAQLNVRDDPSRGRYLKQGPPRLESAVGSSSLLSA